MIDAVGLLEGFASPAEFVQWVAAERLPLSKGGFVRLDRVEDTAVLNHRGALALEMAVHDEQERRAKILESIAHYLGPKATEPVVYYESDWGSEEWTRGAYAASFDLGGLHRYGKDSRTPVGPIHYSCSDIAAEGYQHVDGAIRMGHRTAADIVSRFVS